MKIEKSEGTTTTEELLSNFCERTFMKLWSWSNPYKKDNHELCDLLAVFDQHVYIFFDRESKTIQDTGKDINITWPRWKKEVIDKQIRTAKGAERYIKNRKPIYLDSKCEQPFPVAMPNDPIIHKIIIVHGAEDACKSFSEDNVYGSLGISYSDSGPSLAPFCVRLERDNPIHILDSSNMEILLTELDTFSDFVSFIEEKEQAIRKYDVLTYCGEEDLLAHYFLNYDESLNRYRIGVDDQNINCLWICEGEWRDFKDNGLAERRRKANEKSYLWDELIQRTYQFAIEGTTGGDSLWGSGNALYEMAKEHRISRRILSRNMLRAIRDFPPNGNGIAYKPCYLPSLSDSNKMYVFLQFRNLEDEKYHESKEYMLEVLCGVTRNNFSEIKTIVGIAMNAPKYASSSQEYFALLKCEQWSDKQRAHYERENKKFGFFKNVRKLEGRVVDFE